MHENGLALPLLAAVILVTALVSSPSHRDGSLRRGGRVGLGVTDCYLKNGQGHSLVWDASPGANERLARTPV